MEDRFLREGAIEPRAERRKVPGFIRFLAAGIRRLVTYIVIAGAIAGGLGLVWGLISGSDDLLHSFVLGLWFGGAAMFGVGVLTGAGTPDTSAGSVRTSERAAARRCACSLWSD